MSTNVAFVGICHTSCLPKFGHQMLNCPSNRYIVPAKISPALPLCQKNWFCDKVQLDYFYPLLRSIASSWIHIGIKRISPQPSPLPENYGKNCKTQLWDEKQNRVLFLDHPVCFSETFLDSGVVNLDTSGYNLVRADDPANAKRCGICIYFRKSLPLKILDIHFIHECINL